MENEERGSLSQRLYKRFWKEKRSRRYVIIGMITILIGVGCILFSLWQTKQAYSSRIVQLQMKDIGELSTQAAYFTNVQVISNSREVFGVIVPFTQSKYIYSYDGIIKAGIDFSKLDYAINSNEKKISIYLPETRITSVSIDEDSLVIYDESKNVFSPLKLDDIKSSRVQMETEAKEQAIANGLLTEATENAKVLIKAFFLSNEELSDHEIVWKALETGE